MSGKKVFQMTIGELFKVGGEVLKDQSICDLSLTQIAKLFLSKLFLIDLSQLNFFSIRNLYIESSKNNDTPEKEEEFYKWICKKYLHLEKEPRESLLALYNQAAKDMREIDTQISYINTEKDKLDCIKKSTGRLNSEQRYYRNQLDFYKEKNLSAKSEIIYFITHNITYFATQKSQSNTSSFSLSNFFSGSMPYRYSTGIIFSNRLNRFDVRNLSVMSNKFLDLPVSNYKEVCELYEKNQSEFYEFAKSYISGVVPEFENAISQINTYIKSSHIVNKRKEVLSSIISHYNNKDYISVVNMLPLQVEGIFHDICLSIDIDESRLDISSINEKLRIIESNLNHFIYFEYYSFKFPIIRNAVAHGQFVDGNLEHVAIMLILDLLPVCDLTLSEEIPINKKLQLIKTAEDSNFKNFIDLIEYIDITIPEFYEIDDKYNAILEKYSSDEFWSYIITEVNKQEPENINNSKIITFVKKLNGLSIAKEQCGKFFKTLPNLIKDIKKEKDERKNKIKSLVSISKKN